ncbi:uncharacterized protein MONOS_13943 [Monocercomonoides exilis]|uniref:uncharacterized protein n=1 Tax=Monocercomonoides exilis TaxID=2049356 RepID=UPI00355989BB|nr:hypothetical protein MONOS_13943 [Monocercomonoides exilis]|eukprot:MONOS_13943.1-p1 / transcript=MONOS_13943.1 / gene=MONOS_13943 / organism=Monocercomonoides_exilis_PA203 / gene_product=unspecified product / transcript_product=unspecified product / location=Mono_scaffold00908:8920-10002(-) / protein_length=361 / sequence_SO=supercontig / SO=protein_coding / is_pseudo=false
MMKEGSYRSDDDEEEEEEEEEMEGEEEKEGISRVDSNENRTNHKRSFKRAKRMFSVEFGRESTRDINRTLPAKKLISDFVSDLYESQLHLVYFRLLFSKDGVSRACALSFFRAQCALEMAEDGRFFRRGAFVQREERRRRENENHSNSCTNFSSSSSSSSSSTISKKKCESSSNLFQTNAVLVLSKSQLSSQNCFQMVRMCKCGVPFKGFCCCKEWNIANRMRNGKDCSNEEEDDDESDEDNMTTGSGSNANGKLFLSHINKKLSYPMRVLFFLLDELFNSSHLKSAECLEMKEEYEGLLMSFKSLFVSFVTNSSDLAKKMLLGVLGSLHPFVVLAAALTKRALREAKLKGEMESPLGES